MWEECNTRVCHLLNLGLRGHWISLSLNVSYMFSPFLLTVLFIKLLTVFRHSPVPHLSLAGFPGGSLNLQPPPTSCVPSDHTIHVLTLCGIHLHVPLSPRLPLIPMLSFNQCMVSGVWIGPGVWEPYEGEPVLPSLSLLQRGR